MDIKIPNLGDGIDKANVLSVMVSVGDTVTVDQTLAELETDKAVAPVPATHAGKVTAVHIKDGSTVSEGMPVVTLEGADSGSSTPPAQPTAPPPVAAQPAPPPQPVAGPVPTPPSSGPISASPGLRTAARLLGLDLTKIGGTGHGGRITYEDVQRYLYALQSGAIQTQPAATAAADISAGPKPLGIDFSKWGSVKVEKATSLRQKIGEKLRETWQTAPHVTQFGDADITDLMALRKKENPKYKKKGGNLTLTVFAIKALIQALKDYPQFNASYDEATGELIIKEYFHIGIAVDTPAGLIVPVIRDADKKSGLELAIELGELAQKARDRKVSVEDLQGGSMTISNLGGLGAGAFTPIVNAPEVAILGLGRGDMKPKYNGKTFEPRLVMPVAMSYDHRVIDGADGARFMAKLTSAFESFSLADLKESK